MPRNLGKLASPATRSGAEGDARSTQPTTAPTSVKSAASSSSQSVSRSSGWDCTRTTLWTSTVGSEALAADTASSRSAGPKWRYKSGHFASGHAWPGPPSRQKCTWESMILITYSMSMPAHEGYGLLIESLPDDWREARLLGRLQLPEGPT